MNTVMMLAALLVQATPADAPPPPQHSDPGSTTALMDQAREASSPAELQVSRCSLPADSEGYGERALRRRANEQFDAPRRPHGRTEESPGSRDFILRNVAAFEHGDADFAHMNLDISRVTRVNLPAEKRWIVCRGTFKDLHFLHVSEAGFDDFEVDFSGAVIEWEVKPLDAGGRTSHWAARFYYPEPTTGALDGLLKTMERSRPDFSRLAPAAAPSFEAEWPKLQQNLKRWRGPRSIVYLRREDDGSSVFKVVYGDHAVFWTVGVLDAAGRITALAYEEGA